MSCNNIDGLTGQLKGIRISKDILSVEDTKLIGKDMDVLVEHITFSDSDAVRNFCFWVIWNTACQLNIYPASINEFYQARGKGEMNGFTVPAMNLRTFTYQSAGSIFKVAKKYNAAAFIFEIAKSEIGYTDQRPSEYVSVILAAAVKEGYQGPVFIQGDHFQVKAANYVKDPESEIKPLKELISEAVSAGFFNIDIDSSTLVDLSKATLKEQQKLNYEVCSLFTKYIRQIQPQGVCISVGGEIGEVGKKNSTTEELSAFMEGYLSDVGDNVGISKMSVQTGTSHGGVVLPDGTLAQVKIDFDTLRDLSNSGRKEFKLAGAVQHGASTLPSDAFHKFPEVECAEVHLATQFQNIVYDSLPLPVKEEIYQWLRQNLSSEKKESDTEEQFIYKTRKKALGPFKKKFAELTYDIRQHITGKLEEEFDFLFQQLRIENTKDLIDKYVTPTPIKKKKEDFGVLKDLGELEGAD